MEKDYTKALLKIKTFIPKLRADFVSRNRLIEKLNKSNDKKLICINAPAGYGKSSLIAEWIKQVNKCGAWIQLDENDNDLGLFLSYIVLSLRQLKNNVCDSILPLIYSPQPPSSKILLNNLLNDLNCLKDKTVLVLDDYHLITDKLIHESFSYLIQNLPEKLQIVIISRSELPFSISTIRARNQVVEVDMVDLRFNETEIHDYLNNVLRINLPKEEILELAKKTDGWVSGLQLAALGMKGNEDISSYIQHLSGDDRLIESYFIDEVLSKQEEKIQDFLKKTSILVKFNEELCNDLLGIKNSALIIEKLEKTNSFIIPLDNKRQWFRYHHLFSELLRNKLKKDSEVNIIELYKQTSKWYEEKGNIIVAVDYALKSQDFERTGDLIEKLVPDYIALGGRDIVITWLYRFPIEVLRKKKVLWIYFILALLDRGTFREAKDKLDELWGKEKYFNKYNKEERNIINGYKICFLSSISNHTTLDSQFSKEQTLLALKLLPKTEPLGISIANGHLGVAKLHLEEYDKAIANLVKAQGGATLVNYSLLYLLWWSYISQIELETGKLTSAKKMIEKIIKYANEYGVYKSNVFSNAIICLGRIYFERNDFENAKNLLEEGIELAETKEYSDRLLLGYFAYIPYLLAIKDFNTANNKINSLREVSEKFDNPQNVENAINTLDARIALAEGKYEKINRYKNIFLTNRVKYSSYSAQSKLTLAEIYLDEGEYDKCITLLQEGIMKESENNRMYLVIKMHLILTLAYYSKGSLEKSIETLQSGLLLAESELYIRSFLDGGHVIKELINNLLATNESNYEINSVSTEYLNRLLNEFKSEECRLKKINHFLEEDRRTSILTDRELEVLSNLSFGYSYKEVSDKMYISENTLKSHIKKIYSKLETHNRTGALLKAKELNLL